MREKKQQVSSGLMSFRHSIQAKLLIIVLALTIIPLVGLQTYSTLQSVKQNRDLITQRFTQIAEAETRFITEWASELLIKVRTLATLEAIQNFDLHLADLDLR